MIGRIVRFCAPELHYDPRGHVDLEQIKESRLFPPSVVYVEGDVRVWGRIGETSIELSQVIVRKFRRRGDEGPFVFKGVFFVADFNKQFEGATLVLPDVAERLLGSLGSALQELKPARYGELVQLEAPEFEEQFVVYSTDQIEARYILSPSLVQRITEFKRKSGKGIRLSFVRSRVHVAISSHVGLFEPRMARKLSSYEAARRYFENVQLVLGIVEDLDLNTRIWTKT